MQLARRILLVLCASTFSVAFVASVHAQSPAYPDRPIKLIVPYAPGGSADFTARLIAQKMGEGLGQPVVVDNRPGANGIVGADLVAKAPADGYTLLLAPREMGINPSIYLKLPYDTLKDFTWVGLATEGHFVLVANPALPVATVADLVALAKTKPGSIAYGSIGQGSVSHLNMETMKQKLGIDLLHVPYKGAGPALAATVSAEVGVTIAAVPGAIGFIKSGRLKPLAVGSPARLAQLPDVPTIGEAGGGADSFQPTFFGLAAPLGTPAGVVAKLNAELKRTVGVAEVVEKLATSGMSPVGSSPEVMGQTFANDIARFGTLVKAIGIMPE